MQPEPGRAAAISASSKGTSHVVLVHGMWSTPETLQELTLAFENEGYQVHVPRLPHHWPRKEMSPDRCERLASTSIEEYVDALLAHVQSLPEPPILVGHSMGGLLAQLVAARTPCQRLILISSAAPAGINGWRWSVVRTFGRNLFRFPLWRKTTQLLLANIAYGVAQTQSADVQKEILKKASYESGLASTQIGMWFLFRKPATRVDSRAITCPILVIGGTEDRLTPLSIQRKIASLYPGQASLKAIEGACHWTVGGSFLPQIRATIFNWIPAKPESATEAASTQPLKEHI